MKITSCVLPNEHSARWRLFLMLAHNEVLARKGVQMIPLIIQNKCDIAKIPNAHARAKVLFGETSHLPLVIVDGNIVAEGRLLTASEYEDLIDGISIQDATP